MFLCFNGFDSLCSRPSIAVVCLMIPSVTVVLDYHILWTYEVLYCKKLFKLTRPSKRVSFVLLRILSLHISSYNFYDVIVCWRMYIYTYTCVCIHIVLYTLCLRILCVYILYIALCYGYLPSFGYVRTSSLEVCEFYQIQNRPESPLSSVLEDHDYSCLLQ